MIFNIITLFPEYFSSPLRTSLLDKAVKKGLLDVHVYNLRDFTPYRHKQCDDKPYGGDHGMLLMVEPVYRAVSEIKKRNRGTKVIYFSPQGRLLSQETAKELLPQKNFTLLCGHYEGVDNRIVESLIDEEISVGDYILNGGESASLVFIEVMSRLIPGFVRKRESVLSDSLEGGLLKYPQYTRPADFMGLTVPEVLVSGDHKKIREWRKDQQQKVTKNKRPDLLKNLKKGE